MSFRGKRTLGCAFLAIIMIAVWIGLSLYFSRSRDTYLAEVKLPSGPERICLLSISEGPFQYEWRPSRIAALIPWRRSYPPVSINLSGQDSHTGHPGATFLFRTVDDRGQFISPTSSMLNFEFVESTGFVFRRFGSADFPHWGAYALTRSHFPRRDPELVIRIRQGMQPRDPHVDLKVPNPYFQKSVPQWKAEPLPIDLRQGQIVARVKSVDYFASDISEAIINFQIESLSESPEWQKCTFATTLEDATGNRGRELSPFEPAWKVHAQAYRHPQAEFPSHLLSPKLELTIPASGQLKKLDQVVEFGGKKCRLLYVAGPGIVEISGDQFQSRVNKDSGNTTGFSGGSRNGKSYMSVTSPRPQIFFENVSPANDEPIRGQGFRSNTNSLDTMIRQFRSDGTVSQCHYGVMSDGNRQIHYGELQTDPGESLITIQLASNPPEQLEFFVAPPEKAVSYWKTKASQTTGQTSPSHQD